MRLSVTKKNLAANCVGNGWAAFIAVALIPRYVDFLGVEAWGVVGMFVSLQAICVLLDLGLSATINRELARLSSRHGDEREMRNLVRTLELIYWTIGALLGVVLIALAPVIARSWLRSAALAPEDIENAIRLMGLSVVVQWPFGLYSGGLLGLQRQVLLSGLNAGMATLRGVGTIFVLWRIAPTLQAFFICQILTNVIQTVLAACLLWRSLPPAPTASRFQSDLLRRTWRFAAGISGITLLSIVLMQMDKVILSRLLTLEHFGYYVLAGAVATSIYFLIVPVFSALSPRFTQLVSQGDEAGLKILYHQGCQLMSVLILPVSVVLALFSKEVLFLWTGNPTIVDNAHLLLTILVAGMAINGLVNLPYAVQLAYGWTRLAFFVNLAAVLTLIPLMILMTSAYGAVGAALICVIMNSVLLLFCIPMMHRRLLKGEQWRWCFEDIGLPLAVSLVAALFCWELVPRSGSRFQLLLVLAGVTFFSSGATFLATPVTRRALLGYMSTQREKEP